MQVSEWNFWKICPFHLSLDFNPFPSTSSQSRRWSENPAEKGGPRLLPDDDQAAWDVRSHCQQDHSRALEKGTTVLQCHRFRSMKGDAYFRVNFGLLQIKSCLKGSWGSCVNWHEPKIEPPSANLACSNVCNATTFWFWVTFANHTSLYMRLTWKCSVYF